MNRFCQGDQVDHGFCIYRDFANSIDEVKKGGQGGQGGQINENLTAFIEGSESKQGNKKILKEF